MNCCSMKLRCYSQQCDYGSPNLGAISHVVVYAFSSEKNYPALDVLASQGILLYKIDIIIGISRTFLF